MSPSEGDPRTATPARRTGYRLIPGDGFSYLLHMRPREWPIMVAHTAFGFFLAVGADVGAGGGWGTLIGGLAVFVIFLNGGTLAINSAFDRDEGDIGYLDAPPPVPPHLFAFSLGLMGVGQLLAIVFFSPLFAWVYAACFLMSIVYSVPPFRWKAIGGLDLLINAVGFGTLTPLAGWALTGQPIPVWGWWVLLAFAPLFTALYPLTQLYQMAEDRARGDRTLAIMLGGVRPSLGVALASVGAAFAMFGAGAARAGIGTWAGLIFVPFVVWVLVLVPWLLHGVGWTDAQHKRGMYRALGAWGLTDVAVLLAFLLP